MLKNISVLEFIEKTASGEPTPGGGSVSALAGSLGAALNVMVYELTQGKKVYNEFEPELRMKLDDSAEKLKEISNQLLIEMENDTTAFDSVMEAFKMPKETEEEKLLRSEAIQEGYKKAIEVPLKIANLSLEALFLMEVLSLHGNVGAITDVGVGALLSYVGVEGALLNVKINLNSMKKGDYTEDVGGKIEEILNIAKDTRSIVMRNVYSILEK
ncbi:MAG: cyclodeaminase/cyclohydrolase family protein [Tissierellia bacterium]|jgi:formiminotetrahydrofolate cyclodeaminase|nr:cyclodeaminase/cyclohydrolase family protein [Tissierellia bacterium]